MTGPTGYWYLDGIDIFSAFAIAIKEGTAGFLQTPERKDSIVHSWSDQNGLDVDTSKIYFKERSITLNCWLFTETETEFWQKRNAFLSQISKPGLRRLTFTSHQGRSYFVVYQSTSGYRQIPARTLRNIPDNMILHEFSITVLEPSPQIEYGDTFLVADDGAFIIT
jgi:hypothetical protein